MRVFALVLLGISLAASPLLAGNAGETGKPDTPVTPTSTSALPDKPVAAKPEASAIESEVETLRSLVEEQRTELEEQRAALKAQELKMEALEEKLGVAKPSAVAAEPALIPAVAASSASMAVSSPASAAAERIGVPTTAKAAMSPAQGGNGEASPLQLRIGSAYLTPVGFMDFTGVFRSKVNGSGIGTNFGSIPFTTLNAYQGNLSEFRESMQNSRIGFRFDALVHDAHVMGYMESDYLGNNPQNVAVSSNSNTLRSRLYWVDVRKDKFEFLGGQTWSLMTPGRTGISPLPGDLFYSQNIDVNYQAGLVWGRIPELRFAFRPVDQVAFAVALDSPEQYIGGSSGAGAVTLPGGLGILGAPNATSAQFNNGLTTLNVPNLSPDIIAKLAFDPSKSVHFEVGGVERQFKDYVVPAGATAGTKSTKTGGGGFINANVEIFKGFHLLTNNYWSDGGGRYIFGLAPDLIVRGDGSISPIRSGSDVSGFEFTHGKSMIYAYYGGVYIARNTAIDTSVTPVPATPTIGYGYAGASNAQNRSIQEETFGFNQTLWRDGKYGALNLMGQYSYVSRNPWNITTGGEDAHLNMVFLNLRYTLPGSAPTLGK